MPVLEDRRADVAPRHGWAVLPRAWLLTGRQSQHQLSWHDPGPLGFHEGLTTESDCGWPVDQGRYGRPDRVAPISHHSSH